MNYCRKCDREISKKYNFCYKCNHEIKYPKWILKIVSILIILIYFWILINILVGE